MRRQACPGEIPRRCETASARTALQRLAPMAMSFVAALCAACCALTLRKGCPLGNAGRHWRSALLGGTFALCAAALPRPASAITFTINYTANETPAFDPTGARLRAIADAAGVIWSDYILDDRNFEFDLSWDDLDGDTLGQYQPGALFINTNIVLDTKDAQGQPRDWFIDPTPLTNEEYSMGQTLYRDLGPEDADFNGAPPGLLETSYAGAAISPESRDRHDLLWTVLHEIGHYIGVNVEVDDDEWDINPAALGGQSIGVVATDDPGVFTINHLDVDAALMARFQDPGERRLPSATDILVMWDESGFTALDLPRVDFIGAASRDWDATLNWIGGRVPDADNQVFVRNGGDVWLSGPHSTAAEVVVDGGSALLMLNNNLLQVSRHVQIGSVGGELSELYVGNGLGAPRLQAQSLSVTNGLLNILNPASVVDVRRELLINEGGRLRGEGIVEVGSLSNDGEIAAAFDDELIIRTTSGTLDLDGLTTNGKISAESGDLRFIGAFIGAFNGTATIGPGRTMTFSRDWTMNGRLVMHGGADAASPAILGGVSVAVGGEIESHGHAIINSPVLLVDETVWNVEGTLSTGSISSRGGSHAFNKMGGGTLIANMTVDGQKIFSQGVFQGAINGADFANFSPGAVFRPIGGSSSSVSLRGTGNLFDASLHKVGAGSAGLSGEVVIVNNPNINVDEGGQVTLSGGVLSINNSGFGKFGAGELILSGPGTGSILADIRGGQLTIAHSSALGAGRVFIQPLGGGILAFEDGVTFANQITMVQGRLRGLGNSTVASDITLFPSGNHTFDVPQFDHTLAFTGPIADFGGGGSLTKIGAGTVELRGNTTISGGLTVAEGALANHGVLSGGATNVAGGALLMGSGQFADVNVLGAGRLSPGATADRSAFSPAILTVEDLVFSDGRSMTELLIQLGGVTPGSGYDQVLVSGNATLAGKLSVSVPLGFSLDASQSFLVIDVAGALSGQFAGLAEGASLGNFRGKHLFITYAGGDGNDVALYTTTPAFAADFDEDGDVDGADLARWKIGFGRGTNNVAGNADGDGDVDGADLLAWQRQLGSRAGSSSTPASAAVPEPGTASLLAGASLLFGAARTSHRRRSLRSKLCG